jgi:gentisate 1,2-dioxygenase
LWHGHYNEGGGTCTVMAAQDAGLYEYMRTLDIRFSRGLFGKQ